jgi:hypothetical protein
MKVEDEVRKKEEGQKWENGGKKERSRRKLRQNPTRQHLIQASLGFQHRTAPANEDNNPLKTTTQVPKDPTHPKLITLWETKRKANICTQNTHRTTPANKDRSLLKMITRTPKDHTHPGSDTDMATKEKASIRPQKV